MGPPPCNHITHDNLSSVSGDSVAPFDPISSTTICPRVDIPIRHLTFSPTRRSQKKPYRYSCPECAFLRALTWISQGAFWPYHPCNLSASGLQ